MADVVAERSPGEASPDPSAPRAQLVETIPLGMEDLAPAASESTADALIRLVDATEETIDLTALYWSLRPNVDDDEDTAGWSVDQLLEDFGAGHGAALYAALDAAAERGVRIRIVESRGFDEATAKSDSAALRSAHPDHVNVRAVNLEDWYGSGIMHQKLWIFDGKAVYVGSANTDWRSMSQVKELGIVIEHTPDVAADTQRYFDTWWALAELEADDSTVVTFDSESQVTRRLPAWSPLVPEDRRAPNLLDRPDLRGAYGWENPLRVPFGTDEGRLLLSGAPREVCVGNRTFDGDVLAATVRDASATVCINVMDFAPVSIYQPTNLVDEGSPSSPVWWSTLFDALVQAVSTRRVHARLLVGEWAHTSPYIAPYLAALDAVARAASSSPWMSAGTLEIRRFRVPGWQETGPKTEGEAVRYPGHTRVNHVKYVVTDRRVNIGTSNMTWDYFSATAGTSVNSSHASLVDGLQALFDRDWESQYAFPIAI